MRNDDLEKEHLDYLHTNGMSAARIYDEAKSDYTVFEKKLISDIASVINELIAKMSSSRDIKPEINVFCMDDNNVNAFCFVTNRNYYIGINSGTYIELMSRVERLTDYIVNNGLLESKPDNAAEFQSLLWVYAFRMILAHEYMHIILGHCDFMCASEAFLFERDYGTFYSEEKSKTNIKQQALEMFADEFAAMDAVAQIMDKAGESISKIKEELIKFYLALLLTFSIFDDDMPSVLRTHPRLGVRLHYIMAVTDDTIYKNLIKTHIEPKNILEEINTIFDDLLVVVHSFSDLLSYNIVESLTMEEIDKEYLELYNTASGFIRDTNSYALYPVDEFERADENVLQDLAEERNLLKEAVEFGQTYDEVRDLLDTRKKKGK